MKLLFLLFGVSVIYANPLLLEYRERNVKFTSDIYKKLSTSMPDNLLVCPLSVEIVLAMVFTGAAGETARQLSVATNLPNQSDKVVDMFSKLIPQLESSDKYTFESANKIYVQNKFKVDEQYKNTVMNKFKSEIENIDFEKTTAAADMNQWVADKTHNKITDLISQKDLNEDSRLMIINAMYFKGQWLKGFKEDQTAKKPFYLNNTHYIETDMMSNKGLYKYEENAKLKAKFLELPYKGDDVTMVIALPDNPEDIKELENNIESVLQQKFDRSITVNIRIPKFQEGSSIKFKEILESLGATLPFQNGANFMNMISVEEQDPLKIAEIVQKTKIEVDEKGTVAAAATAVHMQTWRSGKIFPDIYFYADHPFIYYIKHKTAGVAFIGRYSTPKGAIQAGKYEAPVDPQIMRFSRIQKIIDARVE